jgi:hypothetical protein
MISIANTPLGPGNRSRIFFICYYFPAEIFRGMCVAIFYPCKCGAEYHRWWRPAHNNSYQVLKLIYYFHTRLDLDWIKWRSVKLCTITQHVSNRNRYNIRAVLSACINTKKISFLSATGGVNIKSINICHAPCTRWMGVLFNIKQGGKQKWVV